MAALNKHALQVDAITHTEPLTVTLLALRADELSIQTVDSVAKLAFSLPQMARIVQCVMLSHNKI